MDYFFIVDYIEAFLWAIAYALIALVGLVNKEDQRLAIPKISLLVNFAWEVASIFELGGSYLNHGSFGRFAWLIFDIAIVFSVYFKNKHLPDFGKKAIRWIILWFVLTAMFYTGFKSHELFMPYSAFVIDIEMAILFFVQRKKLDPSLRIYIAATKLMGDILAGLYCSIAIHYGIAVITIGSFVFNVLYLIYAVREAKQKKDINDSFNNNVILLRKKIKSLSAKEVNHHKRKSKKNEKRAKTHRKKY